ncbi:hypothetical protein [Variovorax saccharolyticus]|uniref:hypothetical protein n=1 Tax=Variovorax saccharolyticus TaxID=3053516 RepID=UPI002577EC69|nr:hypothetical protein [Variovorax sp. J31P216]MDM0029575.1 hypothetical protein [Variovorax sp. J31P216]
MQKVLRKLIEIRLRQADQPVVEAPIDQGDRLWVPDTPFHRARLAHAVERRNSLFGAQTHWIEEREA